MNYERLNILLREMLPSEASVAAGPIIRGELTATERQSLGSVQSPRADEFASGRAYAKRALAELGFTDVDLPIGPKGSAVWPKGATGSITHTSITDDSKVIAAVVGHSETISAIGIDMERENAILPRVWPHIFSEVELSRIIARPLPERSTEAQYLWCAKEAIAKLFQIPFDPTQIEIERDSFTGHFATRFLDADKTRHPRAVVGRTAKSDDLCVAIALLPHNI